ncbi:flagellar basal body rod protein FlgB [Solimonas marina]|uniref:Flagellar basal body rod protein FlgB n=1 Tax=Solimonas marina TaxID=2714601 RepID=A0A969WA70_9GAMM|nr:flagellar basal body rod protein FlgB [Solimonas marina]NKF21751.1 flagellar basal body rod protein FlgB [Solimonas marina]
MAIDSALFGIQEQALQVQRRRMELIAANIANADTPGYQARDLDFRAVLQDAQASASGGNTLGTDVRSVDAQYRVPLQPSVDGNTVDTQVEQGQFADAALRYQASLNFLDARIKSLMSALSGQ